MTDESLDRISLAVLLASIAGLVTLLILAVSEAGAENYQRATVLLAVSLFVLALGIFVYERGFTPGVAWVLRGQKRAGTVVDGKWELDPEYELVEPDEGEEAH
jgi:hypothetical protein